MSASDTSASYTGGKRSWLILFVLYAVYLSDYADRMVVSSVLGFIKEDWGISDSEAGWLMSIVTLCITVFGLPAAILIDRWSRRKMIAIMTFFWSLATLACAFTKTYTQLLIARAFIGIGEAGYAPGGSAMISAAFPEEDRAKAMGIWNSSIPLGMGIGMIAGGLIAKKYGWQHAFGIVAFPGMLLALAAWFLPDYKTVKIEASAGGEAVFPRIIKMLKTRSLLCAYLGFAMNVSVTTALVHFLPTYFERMGYAEKGKGGMLSSAVFALILVGAPLGGYLADKWHKKNKRARMLLPAITSGVASILLLASLLSPNKATMLAFLLTFGVTVTAFIAPAAAVTQDVVHPGSRALSYSLNVLIQHILGDVWSPPLVGALSDRFGGLDKAFLILPIYGLAASAFFFAGGIFYEKDLANVDRVELVGEVTEPR